MYQLTEINQRLEKGQLICPIPHRLAMGSWAVRDVQLNHSYTTAGNEEEPSFEILGIFLSKGPCVDQTTVNNSVPYFYGSPPIRSDNPLVHDAEFIRKGAPSSSPVNISQKTSCGATYATKPSVRIEGFALKGQKPHCNLSALA